MEFESFISKVGTATVIGAVTIELMDSRKAIPFAFSLQE
jgi:hypothetical protein